MIIDPDVAKWVGYYDNDGTWRVGLKSDVDPGGGSFPDFTGNGSPEGVITAAAVGQSYIDRSEGIVYWFDGTPATNVGWAPDMRAAYPFTLEDAIWADDGSHYPWMLFGLDNNGNDLVAFAWGQGTDEYPRVCFVTDPHDGFYFGDGTFNAYEDAPPNGGVAQFKAGVKAGYGFITLGGGIVSLDASHSVSIACNDPTGTVSLGSAGGAPVVVHDDVTFPSGIGPVLNDTSDGHTYRIVSTNGVLSTQLVT